MLRALPMVRKQILSKQETMWCRSLRESAQFGWGSKCVHVVCRKYVDNRTFQQHHSQMTNALNRENINTHFFCEHKHYRFVSSFSCCRSITLILDLFFFFLGISILQVLPYYKSQGTYSVQLGKPVSVYVHFPYLLMAYIPLLAIGEKLYTLTINMILKKRC